MALLQLNGRLGLPNLPHVDRCSYQVVVKVTVMV